MEAAPEELVCPTCEQAISSDNTLWTYMARWYCSEPCVRKALRKFR